MSLNTDKLNGLTKPPDYWTYCGYNATLKKNGHFFAIVTPDGKDALTPESAIELVDTLTRGSQKTTNAEVKAPTPVACGDWFGVWRRASIVAIISALPVALLSDRWPWVIAVPIIGGTIWVVWADLSGQNFRRTQN